MNSGTLILNLAHAMDKRRARRRKNAMRRMTPDPFLIMSDAEFIKCYRLSKELVKQLINDVYRVMLKEKRRDGLSVTTKVLIALAFYGTGSYQNIVGQSMYHYVSQPSVSRAVRQVTKALNEGEIFKKFVKFPLTSDARNHIKKSFYEKFKIPGVVGCIDGTHVGIVRPKIHEERYFNRKGYHSLNVMVICDTNLNILCVDPSNPGSTHDSVVWRDHPLNHYLKNLYDAGEIMFLLGDSGYSLRKTLMTPILNAEEGSPEAFYYECHVTARNTVERCIGVLKARFRCLLVARKLHYSPETAANIVNACTVLHNIANAANVMVPTMSHEDSLNETTIQAHQEYNIEPFLHSTTSSSHNNVDLQEGRQAQQSLVRKLWAER